MYMPYALHIHIITPSKNIHKTNHQTIEINFILATFSKKLKKLFVKALLSETQIIYIRTYAYTVRGGVTIHNSIHCCIIRKKE